MKPNSSFRASSSSDTRHIILTSFRLPLWVEQKIQGFSIRQKIGLGYSIAIGAVVLGTLLGLSIGDYYQSQALQRRKVATHQKTLLNNLNMAVVETRSYQQQLIPLLDNPVAFDQERHRLRLRIVHIDDLLKQLRSEANDPTHANQLIVTSLNSLLHTYDGTVEVYWRNLETLLERINPTFLQPKMIPEAQGQLLAFNGNQVTQQFDQLTRQLSQLAETAQAEEGQAELSLEQASVLRQQIVALSMILGILIAIFWGICLSRELAKPLETATRIAQQVTTEANFSLQVPITTQDEVGMLARSLNQLIQWVDKYTQELKQVQQTLERRVTERTEELVQKNQQLEQAHSHLSDTLENLKQTQTQLVQVEKMSSLGQLVAGVAHEINNPVNFIHGNLSYVQDYAENLLTLMQMYQQHYPDPVPEIQAEADKIDLEFLQEDLTKILTSMKVGTDRIRQIVLSLRTFSRMDEGERKTVDLHEGIDSTLMILQNRLKAKGQYPPIALIKEYGELPSIDCYAGQLNQVFMNVLVNALDALEERDEQQSVAELKQNPSRIVIRTEKAGTDQVAIRFIDNGPGISEMVQKRLFDPFFTTKAVGKGTGLGLSISYQIVTEKHRGQISCLSTLGEGTEFRIQIPLKQIPLS